MRRECYSEARDLNRTALLVDYDTTWTYERDTKLLRKVAVVDSDDGGDRIPFGKGKKWVRPGGEKKQIQAIFRKPT